MRTVICLFFLLGSTLNLSAQEAPQPQNNMVRVKAHVVEQNYCRGDADLFSVLLGIEIEVENPSKSPVYLLWPMIPWVGKVASSVGNAEAGRFLYQQTASYYPQSQTHFERLKLEPGKKLSKRSEYYLIAKRNPTFSIPKSVSPGTYAMVEGPDTLTTITTEPIVVEVSAHPKLDNCEAGGGHDRGAKDDFLGGQGR
jgi:hypothetical protein